MAFNGRFIVNITQFAGQIGADSGALLAMSGKGLEDLCQEDCIVDNTTYNSIIERAIVDTQDPVFGLHVGENLNLAAAGLIAQITQSSQTIKQALEYCCEFANLGCSVLPMSLIEEKGYYKIIINPDETWSNESQIAFKHTADGVLAFSIREFQSLTQMKYSPLKVNLPWDENYAKEYERVFSSKVEFNSDELSIELSKQHVEEKILTSDYDLLRILVAHAQEKSEALKREKGFVGLVKQSVLNMVKPEFPTIDQVASHLNLSSRTLQRKLHEEGSSFKELINQLKEEMAVSYLKDEKLNISDVAYLLSYSDPSSFIRSFKKWKGITPREYRLNTA